MDTTREIIERNKLAADIAARVRLYTWQPMPPELADALGDLGWSQQFQFPAASHKFIALRLDYRPGEVKRLEMGFDINGRYNVARFLWTPELMHNGARQ